MLSKNDNKASSEATEISQADTKVRVPSEAASHKKSNIKKDRMQVPHEETNEIAKQDEKKDSIQAKIVELKTSLTAIGNL